KCRQNVPMRISTRHSIVLRLLLCIVAALLLALPSTALARGVKTPTRAFHPVKPVKKAKPKRGARRHAPQRVVIRPHVHRVTHRPVRRTTRPATHARPAA